MFEDFMLADVDFVVAGVDFVLAGVDFALTLNSGLIVLEISV
ncbi:hypothetical protein [Candidatus Epulonipiscium viviparus]|nr:hypothetical protein [Candidatus Epulopiscium viviparus]